MGKSTSTARKNDGYCQDMSKGVISVNANKTLAISPFDIDVNATKSKQSKNRPLLKATPTDRQNNIRLHSNAIYSPYIFFTNLTFHNKQKLYLFIDAYCKQIYGIEIPTDIIAIIVAFYPIQRIEPVPLPQCVSIQNNEIMCIDDNKEHIFKDLYLWETDLVGMSTLRITVCNDLVLKEGSKIIGPNKGRIILNVMGDLEIGRKSKIICSNGDIFIKSKNLNVHTYHDEVNWSTLIDGNNIYMETEQNIITNICKTLKIYY